MEDLINMTRKGGNGAKWDEHFKTLLLLLLETLGDKDVCYHYKCTSILEICALIKQFSVVSYSWK